MSNLSTTTPAGRDPSALAAALLERHGAALRNYLMLMPGAEAVRVDAILREVGQELAAQPEVEDDPAVWLFTAGRRRFMGGGQRGEVLLADGGDAGKEEDEADAAGEGEDRRIAVHRMFGRLTSKQQEALRLKFQFGFDLEELARITGLSVSGAASLLHHAMQRISQVMLAQRPEAAGRMQDSRITAYALDEMSAEEKTAFVDSVQDGKALLESTDAIRRAGQLLSQVLESGASLPKRRRRRKGGPWWRSSRAAIAAVVALLLGAGGWYAVARNGQQENLPGGRRTPSPGAARGASAAEGSGGSSARSGDGSIARAASLRELKPGEADWERKPFGRGLGQAAGVSGGGGPVMAGPPAGGAMASSGGARSPGSPTGALGPERAAELGGERGEVETELSSAAPAPPDAEAREARPIQPAPPSAGSPGPSAAPPARPVDMKPAPPGLPGKDEARAVNGREAGKAPPSRSPGPGIGDLKARLARRQWPKPDEIRAPELARQVPAEFPAAEAAPQAEPLAARVELARSPWNPEKHLVRVSIRAKPVPPPARRPANLVFAIDVSKSMDGPNRLPLVQEGVRLLAERLRPDDRVAVIGYATGAVELLPSLPLGEAAVELRGCLNELHAGGHTNGYEGLARAFAVARQNRVEGGVNAVVLCTDGNFNWGETDESALAALAAGAAADGIKLSTFGFGRSDRNDLRLELLAAKGGGRSCYVNTREEAERQLAGQIDGLLEPVATGVAVNIGFNPKRVVEARRLDEGAGKPVPELLPGRSLTALYEVRLANAGAGPGGDLADLTVDYHRPGVPAAERLARSLDAPVREWGRTEPGFRFAVAMAEFGRILQGEASAGDPALTRLESWVRLNLPEDTGGYRRELLELLAAARQAVPGS